MAANTTLAPEAAGKPRDLVFVSYSHKDADWLDHLSTFLKPYTREGLNVWADPYIQVGDQWRRNISAALNRTCVGVLLVSQDFLASDFIHEEELPALVQGAQSGSVILFAIPISASTYEITPLPQYQWARDPKQPLDRLKKWNRNAALVEIAKKIAHAAAKIAPVSAVRLERMARKEPLAPLQAVTNRTAQLHGVPGQRPNYLRREDYFEALKQAVLSSTHQAIGITGMIPAADITRIGLHGMGGIGKTVLAIDLVNTEEIRRAFPDGIFWLTIGQDPEPLRLQGELARFIAGEPRAISTVHEGRDQLRQLFEGKSCLLVLDDLWRVQDAEPFDVLGPRSRLLTTTRDADVLVALDAPKLALNVLSEDLALALLASWSGQARETLPPAARQVAESCGYLPLALALAGARVRGGDREVRLAEMQ